MDDLTNPIEGSWQRRVEQRQGEKEGEKLTQTADHVNRPALAVWNELPSHDMATVQLSHMRYKSCCESRIRQRYKPCVESDICEFLLWLYKTDKLNVSPSLP